jgi:DNA-binding NarL/FixJ family response regulator
MLDGLAHVFASEPDFIVVACVSDGESALQAVQDRVPDIIVLDLALPKKNGLMLLADMKRDGLRTRPVVFTAAPYSEIVEAVRLGVPGVVTKDMPLPLLVRCIREVNAGGKWLEKGFAVRAVSYLLKREEGSLSISALLTPRELAVAQMASEGLPNKRIATRLSISEGTTKLHLHRIYQKLQLSGRMALMNYMQKSGLR